MIKCISLNESLNEKLYYIGPVKSFDPFQNICFICKIILNSIQVYGRYWLKCKYNDDSSFVHLVRSGY